VSLGQFGSGGGVLGGGSLSGNLGTLGGLGVSGIEFGAGPLRVGLSLAGEFDNQQGGADVIGLLAVGAGQLGSQCGLGRCEQHGSGSGERGAAAASVAQPGSSERQRTMWAKRGIVTFLAEGLALCAQRVKVST
jgi:hypothetical protein